MIYLRILYRERLLVRMISSWNDLCHLNLLWFNLLICRDTLDLYEPIIIDKLFTFLYLVEGRAGPAPATVFIIPCIWLGIFHKNIDVLIVNLPRCGLSNRIIGAILRLNPKNILYSSCNPDALFRDLKGLIGAYNLDFIEPFDFFPHTPHLECLSVLKKN